MLPTPLQALAAWPQFVAWRLEWNAEREKWDKIPYSPIHGRKASSTNPADWGTYEQAANFVAAQGMAGAGFVFTARDPFFFLDVDKALTGGQWSQLAQELCARFAGAAVEISQSGTGLHIIGQYGAPFDHKSRNIPLGLELYTQERFVALTGSSAQGDASTRHDAALPAFVQQYFNPAIADGAARAEWTTEPDPEWSGPDDDTALVEKALASGGNSAASAFGASNDKVSFASLWTADSATLAAKWPGTSNPYDASSADQALANQLAFWTGRDCGRMERLMWQSGLARAKWGDRPDYLETTILKAAQLVRTVYKGGSAAREVPPPPPPPSPEVAEATGLQVRTDNHRMFFDQQMRHFAGCVYVSGPHRILTPRGELLDQGRFDAVMGGYEFQLDPEGKKMTTSAWEAFTRAQAFIPTRADRLCFRPEAGTGGVIEEAGKRMANAYVPAKVDFAEGDPSPFLNHMRKMLPHGEDLEILLSYMASVVQNPGMKAQWWPIVQGAEGNFKSFLLTIMAYAVGGHYAHMPNMKKMVKGDSNFNGWIDRKLFLGLDEVYASERREFFEGFKTTVTNRTIPIEGKGVEEITGDNRANGMIVTNHQDGVPLTGSGRRYAAFFCAQQTPADMLRDGMTADYIADLKDWLLGIGQYANFGGNYGIRVMGYYLRTRPIEARLDPAKLAIRCPETTSTAAALASGLGRVEQEILEAIGEERPGFCGGWISSLKLDELLDRKRMGVPRNKRRELLKSIGYDWHPALEPTDGRVNNIVAPDNGKPKLFCKIGSIAWNNLRTAADVARHYSEAQAVHAGAVTAAQFAS